MNGGSEMDDKIAHKFVTSISAVLLLFLNIFQAPPANSIINGTAVEGAPYVVTLLPSPSANNFCSGVYFSERVVITAAHCVVKSGAKAGEWNWSIRNLYVSQTGIDWRNYKDYSNRVRVLKIWVTPTYFNRYIPENRQYEGQVDDIAFLFLEKPLSGQPINSFASESEVNEFRNGSIEAQNYGYGCLDYENNKPTDNDGKPYLIDKIYGTRQLISHITDSSRHLVAIYPQGKSICPGDSGSPLISTINGTEKYIGVVFAGGFWTSPRDLRPAVRPNSIVTVFWPYYQDYLRELQVFLKEEPEIIRSDAELLIEKAKLDARRIEAEKNNTFYKDSSACHSQGIDAELQIFRDDVWQAIATPLDWERSIGCPPSHPVIPWTIVEFTKIERLRWRFWLTGSFEVFSPEFSSKIKIEKFVVDNPKNLGLISIVCKSGKKQIKIKPRDGKIGKCPKGYKRIT